MRVVSNFGQECCTFKFFKQGINRKYLRSVFQENGTQGEDKIRRGFPCGPEFQLLVIFHPFSCLAPTSTNLEGPGYVSEVNFCVSENERKIARDRWAQKWLARL